MPVAESFTDPELPQLYCANIAPVAKAYHVSHLPKLERVSVCPLLGKSCLRCTRGPLMCALQLEVVTPTKLGLLMTGGGARGADQARVLKRIGEIKRVQTQAILFLLLEELPPELLMVLVLPSAATIFRWRPRRSPGSIGADAFGYLSP